MKARRAAVGALAEAEQSAEQILAKGNAVDAVVAGVLGACAASAGVLLGPVQILIGGAGVGIRAVDGRVRQPGVGAPRPRGFVEGEDVPAAATVGVPWLPAALATALATAGTLSLSQVAGPALDFAKKTPRHDPLSRIAARGPRALEERPFVTELVAAAGRVADGLLTTDDLASPRPAPVAGARVGLGAGPDGVALSLGTCPWVHVVDGAPTAPAGCEVGWSRAVAAVDRNGTFAVAVFEDPPEGLFIEEIGLRAPPHAAPVRRGEARIRPGDARPAACPAALLLDPAGAVRLSVAAFGAADAYDVLAATLGRYVTDGLVEAHGAARFAALSLGTSGASVLRS